MVNNTLYNIQPSLDSHLCAKLLVPSAEPTKLLTHLQSMLVPQNKQIRLMIFYNNILLNRI